jgi:predicted Zn-dependent protease
MAPSRFETPGFSMMRRPQRWLILGASVLFLTGMDDPANKKGTPPRKAAKGAKKAVRRDLDAPPACAFAKVARPTPPARSMPELFDRMMGGFMKDPSKGFPAFVEELSNMEGPALEGVTLSIAEERQIGNKARTEYLASAASKGYPVVREGKKLDYLKALVARFQSRMTHRDRYPNIEVTLIEAPIPDGQSFPGGFLAFTTALLEEPDEATVAGVVAHELAHLECGHLFSYAKRSKLAEATYSNPPGGNANFDQFFTRQAALLGLMMNPYRPEHESEADCTSATWLYLEGYDPSALVGFFERMHRRNNDQPDNPFFNFGRTHPFSLDRKRHVLERLAQLKRWKRRDDLGLYAENLRRLVPRDR